MPKLLKPQLAIILRREIYLMLLVYLFILFPAVFCLIYISIKIDRYCGFSKFIILNNLFNMSFSILLITSGILIIWWSYTYLVIMGEGSPAQMLGQTRRLVTSGPYSIVRHPSIIGKFLGVLGFGILFHSFSFIFIVIPLLLCYAFYERVREEKRLMELWPDEYISYKRKTPFILPKVNISAKLFKSTFTK